MKLHDPKLGFLRGLLALTVSLAVVASSHAFALAFFSSTHSQKYAQLPSDKELLSANALVSEDGVRLEWSSEFDRENLGFNVYRLRDGKRLRLNREIIPGSVFDGSANDIRISPGSRSYGWLDRQGTADAVYLIESVSVARASRFHVPLTPIFETRAPGKKQFPRVKEAETRASEITEEGNAADDGSDNGSGEAGYPAVFSGSTSHMSASTIEDQWSIAAQTGVKISIRKDGWYRVTQLQMAAVGFSPAVDVRNLQLFADGLEVAISTSQSGGLFGPGDYFEFFGRGLDVPTSDVRTYYLIAAASPGKRVRGEIEIDLLPSATPAPQATPSPSSSPGNGAKPKTTWYAWRWSKLTISAAPIGIPFIPLIIWPSAAERLSEPPASAGGRTNTPVAKAQQSEPPDTLSRWEREGRGFYGPPKPLPLFPLPTGNGMKKLSAGGPSEASVAKAKQTEMTDTPFRWEREGRGSFGRPKTLPLFPLPTGHGMKELTAGGPAKTAPRKSKKKRGKKRARSTAVNPRREYSHAVVAGAVAPSSFQYTVERKDRSVYFSSLLNGEAENFFGQVISTNPASQTINTPSPGVGAPGPARLEIKLQGVNLVSHQVSVRFNEVAVGSLTFFGHESPVQVFDVPLSLLQNGANTIKFTPATGGDVSIVAYTRITYPRAFHADADALKFSLLQTQTLQVAGFSNQAVRLIDYTDPHNVRLIKPELTSMVGGGGYAITVPTGMPRSKSQRLFYATAMPAEQPAAISLNQQSTLNLNTNAADFLIITTNSLRSSLAPLVTARQAQGMNVAVIDVEDVYDEFGYGLHGPQAVRAFLSRASTVWTTKPKYVIFAGDASYDPRNYSGAGNFDLVPTKLVGATYNETASDDWLADFNDDGIADIPIGRLPVRTTADVDLIVSKIVNFTPMAPESAMLVADDPTGYYFNFEQANDQVQAQLPPGMSVQRVNVRTDGPASAKANVIAGFNQGRALVNYTGHGNVDVWSGSAIFKTADATALTNGNKLSFVIVMDCLNGYYHAPVLLSMAEGFLKAPGGGAVAAFASSGLTLPDGQHLMSTELYSLIYGAQPIALGDAIKIAKGATIDIDVRRTWVFFGDPSMKIR